MSWNDRNRIGETLDTYTRGHRVGCRVEPNDGRILRERQPYGTEPNGEPGTFFAYQVELDISGGGHAGED